MANISLSQQQLSLFCSQIKLKRFDDSTLRILELVLSSKDVKLLLELRSRLKEFLRSESVVAIREAEDKPIERKLLILDFLVRAFAMIDDVENCLAMRYEGLVMREAWAISHPELRVWCDEWMNFAEDAFNHGFYSVTAKVFLPDFSVFFGDLKEATSSLTGNELLTQTIEYPYNEGDKRECFSLYDMVV